VAGHSHWAGIRHKKGVNDARRGKIFSKHARLITTAARVGGPDPDQNLRLKYAIDKAKADNMPKDNIERAIKKGSGEAGGEHFETVLYEGYLAGGVAVLIDSLTDNRARTAPDLRRILEHHGGNLAVTGSVSWMFEQKSVFRFKAKDYSEESLLEIAADIGADDVRAALEDWEMIGDSRRFAEVRDALLKRKAAFHAAEIVYFPRNVLDVKDLEVARSILATLDDLENNDDVQNTFANFEFSEEMLKSLG